jgi:hypothetical protein
MQTSELGVLASPLSAQSCKAGKCGKEIRKRIKDVFDVDYLPVA